MLPPSRALPNLPSPFRIQVIDKRASKEALRFLTLVQACSNTYKNLFSASCAVPRVPRDSSVRGRAPLCAAHVHAPVFQAISTFFVALHAMLVDIICPVSAEIQWQIR